MIYRVMFHSTVYKWIESPTEESLNVFLRRGGWGMCMIREWKDISETPPNVQVMLNEQGGVEFDGIVDAYIGWWEREIELATNPPNNVYEGVVEVETEWEVFVNDEPFDHHESLEICGHSPDGFAWGYGGSGVAQLALAMILNETGNPGLAQLRYIHFKDDVLAKLPSNQGWKYTSDQLREWLELAKEINRGNDEILG